MNGTKAAAGLLMLVLGAFLLFSIVILSSGHTSSALDGSEYIAFTLGSFILLIGGIYAVSTASKK